VWSTPDRASAIAKNHLQMKRGKCLKTGTAPSKRTERPKKKKSEKTYPKHQSQGAWKKKKRRTEGKRASLVNGRTLFNPVGAGEKEKKSFAAHPVRSGREQQNKIKNRRWSYYGYLGRETERTGEKGGGGRKKSRASPGRRRRPQACKKRGGLRMWSGPQGGEWGVSPLTGNVRTEGSKVKILLVWSRRTDEVRNGPKIGKGNTPR